jgi:hypothetical protein
MSSAEEWASLPNRLFNMLGVSQAIDDHERRLHVLEAELLKCEREQTDKLERSRLLLLHTIQKLESKPTSCRSSAIDPMFAARCGVDAEKLIKADLANMCERLGLPVEQFSRVPLQVAWMSVNSVFQTFSSLHTQMNPEHPLAVAIKNTVLAPDKEDKEEEKKNEDEEEQVDEVEEKDETEVDHEEANVEKDDEEKVDEENSDSI